MIGVVLLTVGVLLAALGTTVAVSAGAVNRMELYRWIVNRQKGAQAARALLASPERTLGAALGLAASGALLSGAGLSELVQNMQLYWLIVSVLLIALPLLVTAMYAFPRTAGRRWAEEVIRGTIPIVARLAPILDPVLPHESRVRPSSDLTHSGGAQDTGDSVREVMTPRTEIVAVPEGVGQAEVGRMFAESGLSRLPVYRDSLDNIVGMFHVLDLLKLTPGGELGVRPVAEAPASRLCADLLFEMQRDRRQLAVVLDEYGGTAGIATLQDLLEELVDETFQAVDPWNEPEPAGKEVIEMPGTAPAEQIAERFAVHLPADAETVGGMLTRAVGRIPGAGERFELAGLEFDVLVASATRVERVAVRRGATPTVRLTTEPRK
ncbi:MAG: transporter associated domain-containing protein [Gemmatimonadales bacterium]